LAKLNVHPGRVVLVDEGDLPLLVLHRWSIRVSKGPHRIHHYARTSIDGQWVDMHRFILAPKASDLVDHKNHNGLDNRRSNLRICTAQQNGFNRRISPKTKSGFKGVRYDPSGNGGRKVWAAQATLDGKTRRLGRFATPEEAHAAYRAFAEQHHGEFVCPQ
jgi:hypothetical protein